MPHGNGRGLRVPCYRTSATWEPWDGFRVARNNYLGLLSASLLYVLYIFLPIRTELLHFVIK
jgi:hypothetical protein